MRDVSATERARELAEPIKEVFRRLLAQDRFEAPYVLTAEVALAHLLALASALEDAKRETDTQIRRKNEWYDEAARRGAKLAAVPADLLEAADRIEAAVRDAVQLRERVEAFIGECEGGDMFCGGVPQAAIDDLRAALSVPSETPQEPVDVGWPESWPMGDPETPQGEQEQDQGVGPRPPCESSESA